MRERPTDPMESAPSQPLATPALWLGAWWPRLRPWLLAAAGLALCALMAKALHGFMNEVRYDEVMKAVSATPDLNIAMAVLATALSYLILAGYDFSALGYAHAKVPRPTVFVTSFVAYALSNTIGLGPLTGGAIRTRMYTAAGLTPHQIAQVIVFNLIAFGLGITAFGALSLLWGAREVAPLLHLPAVLLQAAAAAALLALGAFLWLCTQRRVLSIGPRWTMRLPTAELAVRQLVISAVELCTSAAALWFLLPDGQISLPTFIIFYAIAIAAGIVSHVPGGVGVFEAVMLLATQSHMATDAMLGALLLNRGIYYVLPLVVATALVVAYEVRSGVAAPIARAAVRLSPRLLAALALVAGIWLLVSGVTPLTEDAKDLLATLHVPLPLIEASHFLGSIAGLGFVLVARGLFHRLDAAWWAAFVLSVISAVLALPKGIALNEAALLSTLAVLLLMSRRQFDRPSSLFAQRLEPGWLLTLAGVLIACTWLLVFAYQEVRYTNRLWWQFELDAEAPRSLRALLAVELAALALGLWQLLRPTASGPLARPSAAELDRAAAIVRASPSSEGCYALTGDKQLMFSPSGNSFLMFGRQGRSWISLFGPIGDKREWADLVWRFVELATSNGGRPAFYQVRPSTLPLYLDCGLHAFKLGEYAQIELQDFNLKGAKRANLRAGMNRGEREGLVFEVLAPAQVDAVMAELRAVSDAWLERQATREKGFSVGRFDEDYLRRLPVAVVRREGRVIAFASLQMTEAAEDAGVDLMRYAPDAPPGTMDYLFAKVLLHMQERGFRSFGLGMSPMAGMATRPRAPRWQRLGRLLFTYGERFYSFRGLYNYKDKFEPSWEARYLTAPGGISPLLVLADVAALIGDGGQPEAASKFSMKKPFKKHGVRELCLLAICSIALLVPALSRAQAQPLAAPSAATVSHGQFDNILLLRPAGTVQQFVMLFTGGEAPAPSDRQLADTMVSRGAMVALVPLDPFYRRLMADSQVSKCVYGGGSVDNFARHFQAQDRMQTYIEPILVGTGAAAAFPYVLLAQSPADNFTGALSVGFCPRMSLPMPLCTANEFKFHTAADKGIEFQPATRLVAPWSATPPAPPAACPATSQAASPAAFVKAVPGATWVVPSAATPAGAVPAEFVAAYEQLASKRAAIGPPPTQLSDLPVVEVPAKTPGKRFAVLISGDGGWASIDKALAAALAKDGVPVVGIDSLRYFWKARTPEGLTEDMDRVIRYYAARWQRSEVVFIGFSQGADVLPFVYNRLPQRTKDSIRLNVLLAPGQKAAFEFHVANWLGKSGDKPILPEAVKLKAANTVCFYGTDEKADALCPLLDASQTRTVAMPGGHHLGGDYDALAAQMLGFLPR
jgi:phosphatidylglycerol lysyltransferase